VHAATKIEVSFEMTGVPYQWTPVLWQIIPYR